MTGARAALRIAENQGRREQALTFLREAIDHGLYPWADLAIDKDPDLNSLHGDPRGAEGALNFGIAPRCAGFGMDVSTSACAFTSFTDTR